MATFDPYRILKVPPTASEETIKQVYLSQAQLLREGQGNIERFKQLSKAYYTIGADPERRLRYDLLSQIEGTTFSLQFCQEIYNKARGDRAPDDSGEPEGSVLKDDDLNKIQVWKEYRASSLNFGKDHPGQIVEASVLESVASPPLTIYKEEIQNSLDMQITNGSLSRMQLEGIAAAAERHLHFYVENPLKPPKRYGFYIGDSAGVGKGRQIAGIILDQICRNNSRHVWFSNSSDLAEDAQRDIRDLGCNVQIVKSIGQLLHLNKMQRDLPTLLFVTYRELISAGRFEQLVDYLSEKISKEEFSGCLVFDEAHKGKNFRGLDSAQSTQTGIRIYQIQEELPKARVVYSSATCVSHVEDMAYMSRLGYWGGHTYYSDFHKFSDVIKQCEMSGMEFLAIDMKRTGRALVRNVSYSGAEFGIVTCSFTKQQALAYKRACEFWQELFHICKRIMRLNVDLSGLHSATPGVAEGSLMQRLFQLLTRSSNTAEDQLLEEAENDEEAVEEDASLAKKRRANGNLLALYWGAHQRFFGQFILALKVDQVVRECQQALANGQCCVIGLQNTGEAALSRAVYEEDEEVYQKHQAKGAKKIVSVCKSIAKRFILTKCVLPNDERTVLGIARLNESLGMKSPLKKTDLCLLTQQIFPFEPSTNLRPINELLIRYLFIATPHKFVDDLQKNLLMKLEMLHLPESALDAVIDRLGGPSQVAEMTGRSDRQVRRKADNMFHLESRLSATPSAIASSSSMGSTVSDWGSDANTDARTNSVNVQERVEFMKGNKLIAIISEASSTGISLHADNSLSDSSNKRRRVHITMQLPWAADQAIQQLGRSHRSNQKSAPVFKLVSSGLGGENRFVSSVGRRLQTLGAITQGDRRASLGAMSLGDFQFESKNGIWVVEHILRLLNVKDDAPMEMHPGVDYRKVVEQSRAMLALDGKFVASDKGGNHQEEELLKIENAQQFLQVIRDGASHLNMVQGQNYASFRRKGSRLVVVFLNRMLGLPMGLQSLLFSYFAMCLDASIEDEKRLGYYDYGITSLSGIIRLRKPSQKILDDGRGTVVTAEFLEIDKGIDFFQALRELKYRTYLVRQQKEGAPGGGRRIESIEDINGVDLLMSDSAIQQILDMASEYEVGGFYMKKEGLKLQPHVGIVLAIEREDKGEMQLLRPYDGKGNMKQPKKGFLEESVLVMQVPRLKIQWEKAYNYSHQNAYKLRYENRVLICGNVVPYLDLLYQLSPLERSRDDKVVGRQPLRCYHGVATDTKQKILGVNWEEEGFPKLLESFGQVERKLFTIKAEYQNVPLNLPAEIPSYEQLLGFNLSGEGNITRTNRPLLRKGFKLQVVNENFRVPIDLNGRSYKDVDSLLDIFFQLNAHRFDSNKGAVNLNFLFETPKTFLEADLRRDEVVKVNENLLDKLLFDPKKKKRKLEKIQKLFTDDDDGEDLSLFIVDNKQKKRMSLNVGCEDVKSSVTPKHSTLLAPKSMTIPKMNKTTSSSSSTTTSAGELITTQSSREITPIVILDDDEDELLKFSARKKKLV